MLNSNPILRRELQAIAGGDSGNIAQHPQLIAKLRESIPHSIRPAPADVTPHIPLDQYKCFEFAFGLAGNPNVVEISTCFLSTYCNTNFVTYLMNKSILTSIAVPSPNDLVLYRDTWCFTHVAVVHIDSIISKWGPGHLWIHGLWEVPADYGDTMAFYRFTGPPNLSQRFVDFAREREGSVVNEVLDIARS